jgi:hypothetical protein
MEGESAHPVHVLLVVHAVITEPAPRNSKPLKKACVTRWKIAAAHAPLPRARNM